MFIDRWKQWKIEDQEQTLKVPSKPLNSLQPSIRKNDIPKMIDNNKFKLQKGTESQKLKLPKIKDKRMDQTNYFLTKKVPQASPPKKIYSADHSKQLIHKLDNEIEFLQQKHLQYLNRIEQLYMLKQK